MAEIHSPNKFYNGVSASVSFVNGVGITENPRLIDWFREHGYSIVEIKQDNKEGSKATRKKVE